MPRKPGTATMTAAGWVAPNPDPSQVGISWALDMANHYAKRLTMGERATLLIMGAAADIALNSPMGYRGFRPDEVAAIGGYSPSTARAHLNRLHDLRLVTRTTVAGSTAFRISEEAFQ